MKTPKTKIARPPGSLPEAARALGGHLVVVRRKNTTGTGYYWFATITCREGAVGYRYALPASSFFSIGTRGTTPREAREALARRIAGKTIHCYRSGPMSLNETVVAVWIPADLRP